MVSIHRLVDLSPERYPPPHPALPSPESAVWNTHQPDGHYVALAKDKVVAHCSLWWSAVPSLPGEKTGIIGHYAAIDDANSKALLDEALRELQRQGCSLAIGPMDGNTWRRYRFVTQRGSEPPFLLEPENPDHYASHFTNAEFAPLAQYTSTLNTNLDAIDDRIERARQRLTNSGVAIRDFRPQEFECELRSIYSVSAVSFRDNFLYTPLPEESFIAQYQRIRDKIRPDLVLMAEHEGSPVGYVFGIPNWLQAARGEPMDTIVLKTVAILPGKIFGGLGNVLVHEIQQRARSLGFKRAIHALMHASNNSKNLSGHYAETFRQYTLFSRRL